MGFTETRGECVKWIEYFTLRFSGGFYRWWCYVAGLLTNAKLIYQLGK
jgi:hypothetical protein